MLEQAELVTGYTGPVYLDGVGRGSFGDGFFSDAQEPSEHLDLQEGERPRFAHCCTPRGLSIDLDSILENATEEMYDDCRDDLNGVDELQTAVYAFNAANESIRTWDPDYKRK